MKERPIIFSGPMVRAILDGRKTQTRRVVKCKHIESAEAWTREADSNGFWEWGIMGEGGLVARGGFLRCPYGVPGDRLWVRETWRVHSGEDPRVAYKAGGAPMAITRKRALTVGHTKVVVQDGEHAIVDDPRWRSPLHMPRWASRLLLEVVSVRVEELQCITETDAEAEGVFDERFECALEEARLVCGGTPHTLPSPRSEFARKWNSINGKRAPWASNPWVWVLEFREVKP